MNRNNILPEWIDVLCALIASRVVRPEIYPKFLSATIPEGDLESYFDATLLRRSKNIDLESNYDCDDYTWLQYYSWVYLAHDGNLTSEVSEFIKVIDKQFYNFGQSCDPLPIPKIAHRKWLDLFNSTSIQV